MQPNNNICKDLSIDPLSMPRKRTERTQLAKKKKLHWNATSYYVFCFIFFWWWMLLLWQQKPKPKWTGCRAPVTEI